VKQSIQVAPEMVTVHEADPRTAREGFAKLESLGRELHRATPELGGYVTMYVDRTVTLQTVLWHSGRPLIASRPHLIGAGAEYRFGPCQIVFEVPEEPDPFVELLRRGGRGDQVAE
jgi:hypothetical protein